MIDNWQEIEDSIIALSGKEPRVTTKGEHIHTCPFCDKDNHFYVNYEKEVYNCYSCGGDNPDARGHIKKLAELMGVEIEDEVPLESSPIRDILIDTSMQRLEIAIESVGVQVVRPVVDNEQPVYAPPGWELLTPANFMKYFQATSYLFSRGIDKAQIEFYKLGVAQGGTKIVFPDFNVYGQLRWWQLRGLGSGGGPKYEGPEATKGGKLGNFYRAATQTWYVGVAEGPISGIIAGYEFMWLWGKEHSPEQIEALVRLGKPVVLALDGEAKAYRNALGLARDLREQGVASYIVPMPGEHDPASLGVMAFRQVLAQTLQSRSMSDLDYLERVVRDYV